MKKYTFIIIAVIFTNCLLAQMKQNNIWYFGKHTGLDFNTEPPTLLNNSAISANYVDATSTICDTAGNLLFYSNGDTVWNKNHQIMENGTGLLGCKKLSSAQGTLIVPYPSHPNLYYLFTTDCMENDYNNGLRSNIIDISLNNGLGKVIEKNKLLYSPTSEHLCAITKENGYDFWILSHEYLTSNFLIYSLDCKGIDSIPQKISIGKPLDEIHNGQGFIKSNKQGSFIVLTSDGYESIFELFKFDNVRGNIIDPIDLTINDKFEYYYGASFSPNGNLFYVNKSSKSISQYDLSIYSQNDIINSAYVITNDTINYSYGEIKFANNNKIYILHYDQYFNYYIEAINKPNLKDSLCEFRKNVFYVKTSVFCGLPNSIETPYRTVLCEDGINENKSNKNYITNNPVKDNLKLSNIEPNTAIKIYDSYGRLAYSAVMNNDENINLSYLADGIYLLQINSGNTIYNSKFLKKR